MKTEKNLVQDLKTDTLCQIQTLTLLLLEVRVALPTLQEAIFSWLFEEVKVSVPDEQDTAKLG